MICIATVYLHTTDAEEFWGILGLGWVWIELIFAEIKSWNWKHGSEIIFKYVNSTVRSIFNKKLLKSVIY